MRYHTTSSYSGRFRTRTWSVGGLLCRGTYLGYGRDKPVSLAGNGLYEARLIGIVSQHLADLADGAINAVVGIQKDAFAPDTLNDLFPRDHLPSALQQE